MPPFAPDSVLYIGAAFTRTDCDGNSVNAYCQSFRRIEYPRSTVTMWHDWYFDHYDDSTSHPGDSCFMRKYFVSTLISHLAYLVEQGDL